MQAFHRVSAAVIILSSSSFAGELSVAYTVQALSGLAGDTPRFDRLYCHDKFAFSGERPAVPLICAPSIPPTNSPERPDDHNLLSAASIKIAVTLEATGVSVALDLTMLQIPTTLYEGPDEQLIAIAIECIRMTTALCKIEEYLLTIKSTDKLQDAANENRAKFLNHDHTKPFLPHPAEQPSE